LVALRFGLLVLTSQAIDWEDRLQNDL